MYILNNKGAAVSALCQKIGMSVNSILDFYMYSDCMLYTREQKFTHFAVLRTILMEKSCRKGHFVENRRTSHYFGVRSIRKRSFLLKVGISTLVICIVGLVCKLLSSCVVLIHLFSSKNICVKILCERVNSGHALI